jgi:glutathione peroxidase
MIRPGADHSRDPMNRNVLALVLFAASAGAALALEPAKEPASLYDLQVKALDGTPVDLGKYKGTVTLVVNTASQCGYTPQYQGLQALREEMKGKGVEVLGFPSNDFGGQEPGSAEEIQTFCRKNYGVAFPMFQKVVTKAGPGQSPVYAFLGKKGELPKWNFSKYVVGKDGQVRAFFGSKVKPEDAELRDALQAALKQ